MSGDSSISPSATIPLHLLPLYPPYGLPFRSLSLPFSSLPSPSHSVFSYTFPSISFFSLSPSSGYRDRKVHFVRVNLSIRTFVYYHYNTILRYSHSYIHMYSDVNPTVRSHTRRKRVNKVRELKKRFYLPTVP